MPTVLASLITELRATSTEGQLGVWLGLSKEVHDEHDRAWRRTFLRSRAAVRVALTRCTHDARYARIDEGVKAFDRMATAWVDADPAWSAELLRSEAGRLALALDELLPPLARHFLQINVQIAFWERLDPDLVQDLDRSRWFWHHRIPQLGIWYPAWQQGSPSAVRDGVGTWFRPVAQAVYEEVKRHRQEDSGEEADSVDASNDDVAAAEQPGEEAVMSVGDEDQLEDGEEHGAMDDQVATSAAAPGAQASLSYGDIYMMLWLERYESLEDLMRRGSRRRPIQHADPSVSAEDLLDAWCEVRGLTAKALISGDRAKVMRVLARRFGVISRQEVTGSDMN